MGKARRESLKIKRSRNGYGATYDLLDEYPHTLGRKMICPTCGKLNAKGDFVVKGSFIHSGNNFVTRQKIFCSYECVPKELKSKQYETIKLKQK